MGRQVFRLIIFMVLYSLLHISEILEDDEEQNVKLLGCFTSKKEAYKAIKRYKDLPGFSEKQAVFYGYDYGEGFFIDRLIPGISYWDGGYTTMEDFAASYGITIIPDENTAEKHSELFIDVPYCMQGKTLHLTASSVQFLESLLNEQYQRQDYPTGPQSEFYQLKELKAYVNSKL